MSTNAAALEAYAVDLATGCAALIRNLDPRRDPRAVQTGDNAAESGDHLHIETKSTSTDLVTAVDRAAEQWLVEHLRADRPDDAVLGEEGGARAGTSGVRWLLDPIDGTVNFVLGLPAYAVSVAAEVDGTVVAGAVCNPVSGELFRAAVGTGAWLGTRRLSGPRTVPLSQAVVGTGFGYDAELRTRQALVAAALLPRIADIRRAGSAALDLCSVAAGRLDAYFEVGLFPWDHSAGGLIAREAGCVVGGAHGQPASRQLTAAAGKALWPAFISILEELAAADISTWP